MIRSLVNVSLVMDNAGKLGTPFLIFTSFRKLCLPSIRCCSYDDAKVMRRACLLKKSMRRMYSRGSKINSFTCCGEKITSAASGTYKLS